MAFSYLFQIDTAENNDAFFKSVDASAVFYRSAGFQIGEAAWIPDGVRVDKSDGTPPNCSLTLIELEDRRPEALKSARKYLPENSDAILASFRGFLRRKIAECRSTADPREPTLIALDRTLNEGTPVVVKTMGALRSSTWNGKIVEELPLIDQPRSERTREVPMNHAESPANGNATVIFAGVCKLDGDRNRALRRCLMVLDAVVRQDDHSSATLFVHM